MDNVIRICGRFLSIMSFLCINVAICDRVYDVDTVIANGY